MANVLRIKRRASGGAAGAPSTLENGELAFNEVDNVLYYGVGTGGAGGSATSVLPIGGPGAFLNLSGAQTVSGNKTFTGTQDFTGASITVPTPAAADNTQKPATTAWTRGFAQPLTAALTAIAALTATGLIAQTSAGVYSSRAVAVANTGRLTITNGDGVSGNPTLDLASGVVTAGTYTKVTVDTYGRVTAGAALASGDVTTALGYTPENPANKGVAGGYASLDGSGKIPSSQMPSGFGGGLNYQGSWNAATNTPTITNGTGTNGMYYKVGTAGNTTIDGNNNWTVGDLIVFNGTTWDKFEGGSPDVVSVAGRTGVITLSYTDISGLGTMATQNANAVNITGGSIGSGVTFAGNAANVTGVVAAANGGTGLSSYTTGDLVYATGATAIGKLAAVGAGNVLLSAGTGTAPAYGKVGLTTHVSGTLPVANGGTGLTAYAVGDLVYASATGTLSSLAAVAAGNVLISAGTGTAPTYGKVGLTTHVSGTLPVANGGSGAATLTGYLKGNGTAAFSASTSIPFSDITGTVPVAQGGTGLTSYTTGDLVYASAGTTLASLTAVAAGNVLLSAGTGTAPAYGKVGLTTHVTGTLAVANGGTGAATLTGYVKGNGTGAMTASSTIPNTDVSCLGTMSTQNANAVAITGGTINNIVLDGGTF